MAQLCVNVVNCCSLRKSNESWLEVKACPGRGDFAGSNRRRRSRSCKPGEGDWRDAPLGFQRIDVGGSLINGARKDLSRANGMSGSKGRANSYEICIIVDCQARDPQLIENIFEHSHVGISQREGQGSILRIDEREDRRIEHEEGDVPKSLRGRYIDDFHVGRRMLLAAFCSSMAFCSCSAPGMAQVELKTTTSMAENGTNRSQVGEKGKGSNVELDNRKNIRASRVYDATVLGEPVPVGGEKGRVWQKLLAARVVYLGEAERVPDPDDKVLELEILRTLRNKCFEQQRPVSLALDAFPVSLQHQLDKYMSKKWNTDLWL